VSVKGGLSFKLRQLLLLPWDAFFLAIDSGLKKLVFIWQGFLRTWGHLMTDIYKLSVSSTLFDALKCGVSGCGRMLKYGPS
jgi:hypothetical protein